MLFYIILGVVMFGALCLMVWAIRDAQKDIREERERERKKRADDDAHKNMVS